MIYFQYILVYFLMCVIYIQFFYKILRTRLLMMMGFIIMTILTLMKGSSLYNWSENLKENFNKKKNNISGDFFLLSNMKMYNK